MRVPSFKYDDYEDCVAVLQLFVLAEVVMVYVAVLPGLRGFFATNLKLMRIFYEEWKSLESNSSVATDELR